MSELLRFNGLNNIADPMRGTDVGLKSAQSWEWQSLAENVDGTDSGGLQRRDGYIQFISASINSAYSTADFSRLFVIDGGSLKRIYPDATTQTLYANLSGPAHWSEINDVVYLSCGDQRVQIESDNVVHAWGVPVPSTPALTAVTGRLASGTVQVCLTYTDEYGREGGASQASELNIAEGSGITLYGLPVSPGYTLNVYATEPDGAVFYLVEQLTTQTAITLSAPYYGRELLTQYLDAPPTCTYLTFYQGRAYCADYDASAQQSVVWFSQPLGYHLFNLARDFLLVPGEITQLQGAPGGVLIATQERIFLYGDEGIVQLAKYGATHGQYADAGDDGKTYFWTKRGLCRVAPFENLTEARVSIAPGVKAGGGVISKGGYTKYVAIINKGGHAFNARSTS